MPIHRRRNYDLDEIMSEVRFEPDRAFEASLRARLSAKLNTEQSSTLWSNGRRPLPDGQTKRRASPADEEKRPMRSSRLMAVFAVGLTAVVAAVMIGLFALPRGGPSQDVAATEEPTAAPTPLADEYVVTDIADLVGVWRAYYPSEHTAMYKEVREDGSVLYGFQVEGPGNQVHIVPPSAGGCVDCTMTFDGSAWQLRGYERGQEAYQDTIGRYEIRMRTNADGTAEHTYVKIEDEYADRTSFLLDGGPWVRIDLEAGERIITAPSALAGVWRGYNPTSIGAVYLEFGADGSVTFGGRVEGAGDALHVIPDEGNACVDCSTTYDGSVWLSSGYADEDKNDVSHDATGRYEMRLLEGEDGSVQLTHVVIEDKYQGRAEWLNFYQPFTRVDLQPGEKITTDLADLAGIWRLDTPEGVLYMEIGEDGTAAVSGTLEGEGAQAHVAPTESIAGFDEPQFLVTSTVQFRNGVLRIRDTGGAWFEGNAGNTFRGVSGAYEVRILMNSDVSAGLTFVEVHDVYEGRDFLGGYGAWTRVEP